MYFAAILQATILAIVAAQIQPDITLITNGQNAGLHSAPWIVSIQSADGKHKCSGSIIDASWIVTAAQCLFHVYPMVAAGLYNLAKNESATEQRRTINYKRVYRHPKYPKLTEVSAYDIGLIYIDPPFKLNKDVQKIGLPSIGRTPTGKADLFGWGSSSSAKLDILQRAELSIWPYKRCLAAEGKVMKPEMLCAGPLTVRGRACFGYAGDPLSQGSQLVGFTSWNLRQCGVGGKPAGFIGLGAFVQWIKQVQKSHKCDPEFENPGCGRPSDDINNESL